MYEVLFATRVFVAAIFAAAAIGKLRNTYELRGILADYKILPAAALPLVALLLGPLEATIAAALVLIRQPWPEFAAAALLFIFTVAIAVNIVRGRQFIECGCNRRTLRQRLSWELVLRNSILILLLLAVATYTQGFLSDLATLEALVAAGVAFSLWESAHLLWSAAPISNRRERASTEF